MVSVKINAKPENPLLSSRMTFITQVLLPKRSNDGQRYRRSRYEVFHARMIQKFGAWTRKGQAEGAWLSPTGDFYLDEHWIYEIGHSRRDLLFWQAERSVSRRSLTRKKFGSSNTKAG
jgi:hypothetical protein